MLRRIVLLQSHEYLAAGWADRSFGGAGMTLSKSVKVRGQDYVENYPVPAFRRLQSGVDTVAAPIGRPRKPAALPHDSYAVAANFEDEEAIARFRRDRAADVVGIFADPKIEAASVYCQNGPVGDTYDVARLLGLAQVRARNLTGRGVRVAIVDTGIDGNHLDPDGNTLGLRIDPQRGYPNGYKPGTAPRNHGTMVAYDVSIAAPQATLLDYALLSVTAGAWQAFLSDAIAVYANLIDLLQRTPGPLVVNNSWGLFDRSDDAPVGSPENYSANANHPFNQIVGALATAGADVIFAAGNCGADCPDGRCGANDVGPGASIHGANSHPAVITVAAVTTQNDRLGYSSQGPGDLTEKKPDIAGYSHFNGSGVYAADGGTSAAAPVVAGVVAMLRQQFGTQTAAEMKGLVQSTAHALNGGWNYDTGYGLITTDALSASAAKATGPTKRRGKRRAAAAWMHKPTPAAEPVVLSRAARARTAKGAAKKRGRTTHGSSRHPATKK